jgi:thiol-disulfide isomerase/thioredoxin
MSLRPLFDIENNPKKYPNALHHFAHEYFADIDFTDEDLSYMMPLWENVGTYTRTLVRAPEKFMRKDSVYFFLDQLLQKPKKTSRVYRLVLSGITSALHEEESSQLQKYAALYAKAFPEEKEIIGQHKSKTDALIAQEKDLQQFLVGATPPEIALPNEVGAMVTLSSQKGKYVLVEFWSSSSLPSKRQLPTLAKLYKRYKDKGFEIMSIGIEKNKKEWSEIILQGKMTWLNVSDLLGWNSPLVQTYHIKDVPANYLLDKEGKIVAKNIFGKELEATLYNLFPLTEDKRTGK